MIRKTLKKNRKNNSGYTLLFAVLVAAVTLAIGISILNISKKEFILASTARDSSIAFYAADSGLECAWFYEFDNSMDYLATSTGNTPISCGNSNLIAVAKTFSVPKNEWYITFSMPLGDGEYKNDSCAFVTITKWYGLKDLADPLSMVPRNKIESRGYNLGWSDYGDPYGGTCDPSSSDTIVSPLKVERAIRVIY